MAIGPTSRPAGPRRRRRLGELLVASGHITAEQLQHALSEQSSWGGHLGQNLVDRGFIDERTLATAIADQLGIQFVDLDRTPPQEDAVHRIPVWVAEPYGVLGVSVSFDRRRILVACFDPTSWVAMHEVRRVTGLAPSACVATASQIDRVMQRCYYGDSEEEEAEPSPHPHLHVTRQRVAREVVHLEPAPDEEDRLAGLERRLDQLLELVASIRRP